MIRSKLARSLLLVASAALALTVASCSRDTHQVLSPSATGTTAQHFSLRNPAHVQRMIDVQNASTAALMRSNPDVIGTGIGMNAAGEGAMLVLTRRATQGLPAAIQGVPVEQRVVGDVVAYARPISPGAKPGGGGTLQMGTSTGNDLECSAGTLGCVVTKGGTRYFLSNNHVFARENAARIGERIDAPGRYDGKPRCAQTPQCANLSDFHAVSFTSSNVIDCAIAQPISGLSYTAAEAGGYAPSSTTLGASVGLAVKKTGRTSGLTHDTIQAINVTIQVQYSAGIATFVSQIMTSGSFIRSGDSGSLMVTETGNNPVGLCFAGGSGGSFENPIDPVLQNFSATVASN